MNYDENRSYAHLYTQMLTDNSLFLNFVNNFIKSMVFKEKRKTLCFLSTSFIILNCNRLEIFVAYYSHYIFDDVLWLTMKKNGLFSASDFIFNQNFSFFILFMNYSIIFYWKFRKLLKAISLSNLEMNGIRNIVFKFNFQICLILLRSITTTTIIFN